MVAGKTMPLTSFRKPLVIVTHYAVRPFETCCCHTNGGLICTRQVLIAVNIKITVCWDVTPCRLAPVYPIKWRYIVKTRHAMSFNHSLLTLCRSCEFSTVVTELSSAVLGESCKQVLSITGRFPWHMAVSRYPFIATHTTWTRTDQGVAPQSQLTQCSKPEMDVINNWTVCWIWLVTVTVYLKPEFLFIWINIFCEIIVKGTPRGNDVIWHIWGHGGTDEDNGLLRCNAGSFGDTDVSKESYVLVLKRKPVQEERLHDPWIWKNYVPSKCREPFTQRQSHVLEQPNPWRYCLLLVHASSFVARPDVDSGWHQ